MKLMTRNTDYAVRAVCYMAARPQLVVSVTELVKELRIPKPFLRKILQLLTKSGITESYRGLSGGFRLAVKPEKMYLSDIINVFQEEFMFNECFLGNDICPNRRTCPLKKRIDLIQQRAREEIGSITILSLLKGD